MLVEFQYGFIRIAQFVGNSTIGMFRAIVRIAFMCGGSFEFGAGQPLLSMCFHEKAFKLKGQNFNFGGSRRVGFGEMNVESRFHSHSSVRLLSGASVHDCIRFIP